jgi:hypothetical protein
LQVLVAACVDLVLGELDLSLGHQDENTDLENADNVTESYTSLENADDFTIYDEQGNHTRAGIPKPGCRVGKRPDPTDCSKYYWCVEDPIDTFTVFHVDCPGNLVYNPHAYTCMSSSFYTCVETTTPTTTTTTTTTTTQPPPPCTGIGFSCPTTTTFSACLGPGVPPSSELNCPNSYFCNPKCSFPCLKSIQDC